MADDDVDAEAAPPPPIDPLVASRELSRETVVALRLKDKRLYHVLLRGRGKQFDALLDDEELNAYARRADCVRLREKMWLVVRGEEKLLVDVPKLDELLSMGVDFKVLI